MPGTDSKEVPPAKGVPPNQQVTHKQSAEVAFSPAVRRVLMLLEDLNASRTGTVLYRQVQRLLAEAEQQHHEQEQIFRRWIHNLLDAYLQHLVPGSTVYVQARLIQKQLDTPLSVDELKSLRRYIDLYTLHSRRLQNIDEKVMLKTLEPLLKFYGGSGMEASAVTDSNPLPESAQQDEVPLQAGGEAIENEPPYRPGETVTASEAAESPRQDHVEEMIEELLPAHDKEVEAKLANTYRKYLDSQQRNAEKVQKMLAQRIQSTIEENRQFGSMLDSVRNGLLEAENLKDIETLRRCLLEDVEGLSKTHHGLIDNLDETKRYLRMLETDSRKLSDELARVRMLSMTDELTELPNRRAFMRRLEDEVGRTKRYGFRLALAMIDLDKFKNVNDRYGHAGGDAVLRTFATDILTVFRQHDMVARYGGEEFAVLLPNTDEHGAMAALNKVRRQIGEIGCARGEDQIPLPTISVGLTMYVKGDTPESLIQRADEALYTAKRLGRNRVEVKYGIQTQPEPVKFRPMKNNQ